MRALVSKDPGSESVANRVYPPPCHDQKKWDKTDAPRAANTIYWISLVCQWSEMERSAQPNWHRVGIRVAAGTLTTLVDVVQALEIDI
jgi:hypothetical protein